MNRSIASRIVLSSVTFAGTFLCVAACGDNVNINLPGNNNNDAPYVDSQNIGKIDGADAEGPSDKDSGANKDSGNDVVTETGSTSCTTGYVRCEGGFAQECIASSWVTVTPAAPCTATCTAALGKFTVDRNQVAPAPSAIVRKDKEPVLFLRTFLGPTSFEQSKTICSQFGPQWRVTFFEPSVMSADVLGCNPLSDQAAFPGVQANQEIWAWNGGTEAYIFSFADNQTKPTSDMTPRKVMCVRDIP